MSNLMKTTGLVLPRAITGGIRADVTPQAVLTQLNQAFEEFKTTHAQEMTKKADVVVTEKVQRLDAAVGDMQTLLDELAKKVASGEVQDNVIGDIKGNPAYTAGFKAFMRKGTDIDPAVVQAAMTKGSDADGGYLAPIEWDRTITDKLKVISPVRENARVMRISGAGFKKLFNDRAVGSGWVGETAARPATSTPQIGTLDFVTGELYANPAISQQLLDDAAINLETWLADEVETEFARQEGIAFLSGDGANKPFGILTYVTGAANAAKHPWGAIVTTNAADDVLLAADDFINLYYSLRAPFAANAKIYINRLNLAQIRKLKDTTGAYVWQPSYVLGQPATIGGVPVVEIPDMPVVAASAIAALYGDMSATYMVIDRIGITVLRDPYTNKPYVHFYTVKRVGGGVYNPEPMVALKMLAS